MTVRTRKFSLASTVAAVGLLSATLVSAADETPYSRHVDIEVGVGAHIGAADETPLTDDVMAGIGVAVPVADHVDAEFNASYLSGRDFNTRKARDAAHATVGFRFYPWTEPADRARFYFAVGPALLWDYRPDDDVTLAVQFGPGVRLRAGKNSGMLIRVPLAVMTDEGGDPLLIPTFNLFYQF